MYSELKRALVLRVADAGSGPCAVRGCRVRGVVLLLREHALADGDGVVHDRRERDALGVMHEVGARACARAPVVRANVGCC